MDNNAAYASSAYYSHNAAIAWGEALYAQQTLDDWWLYQLSNAANYRPESDSERVQREIKELRRKYRQKRQARSQA